MKTAKWFQKHAYLFERVVPVLLMVHWFGIAQKEIIYMLENCKHHTRALLASSIPEFFYVHKLMALVH